MDFASIVLFLFIYYIRPQEWIGIFAKAQPVKLIMLVSLVSTFSQHKGLSPKEFFKTPHDYAMAAYIGWAIYAGGSFTYMFMEYLKYIVFYWIIVIVLNEMKKIQLFLNWWAVMILGVAALGVSSLYFWDPTHSKHLTESLFEGRLVLRMSIF